MAKFFQMGRVRDPSTASHEESPIPYVLGLHVWLKGLSPMIWRRIHVRSDSSLADLHYIVQMTFGWEDIHLNHFHIHGRDYGIYHDGRIMYDEADKAKLSDFSFRRNEKFLYEYDLNVPWQHVIRIEDIYPLGKWIYPTCIAAQGIAPPEDCGGRDGFFALPKYHIPNNDLLRQGIEIIERVLKYEVLPSKRDMDEIRELQKQLSRERDKVDRRKINRRLKLYASGDPSWMNGEDSHGNSTSIGNQV